MSKAVALERRSHQRKSIYLSDRIKASLHCVTHSIHGHCKDISPESLSVVFPNPESVRDIEVGTAVHVEIETPVGRSLTLKGKIANSRITTLQDASYLTLSVHLDHETIDVISLRRKIGRPIAIEDFLQPQAYAQDPVFFSESFFFRVGAFGRNGCRLLATSDSRGLFPGIQLTLTIFLPNFGEKTVQATPLQIGRSPAHPNLYFIDVEFQETSPAFLEAVSEYLLAACPSLTITTLRNEGFFVGSTNKALIVTYPQTPPDFERILDLRFKAYKQVGKFQDKKSPEEMRDSFDSFSRQLICKVGGSIVGAVRLVFVGHDRARSEHLALGIEVPDHLFKKGFIEMSRACTNPDFRGSDVFPMLIRHTIRIALEAEVAYVVANCNSDMWPLYKKIGAKKIGQQFEAFGRKDCQLIAFETRRVTIGADGDFTSFNQLVFPVSMFWNRRRSFSQRIMAAPRHVLHFLFSPLISGIRTYRAYRRHHSKKRRS